jgi:hypothetical protein
MAVELRAFTSWALDQAPLVNFIGDSIAFPRVDPPFRLQPCLSHRTFDDMPLHPFAMWTSERAQVSAAITRLDRRELHRRPARRALRTLVLCVEHGLCL